MHIALIRHLPTYWNKKTWLQGRRDIEISEVSEKFRNEISHNQQLLKAIEPFDLVLVSTLKRTHQTAEQYGYVAKTEGLLDELDFGPYEGKPKEELFRSYGDKWVENPKELILGESVTSLEKRIVQFIKKYEQKDKILVFGHGSWIRAMVSYYQYGHINNMNKMTVGNNECIILPFNN